MQLLVTFACQPINPVFLSQQTSGAAGYSKFVTREMSKAEALLKVHNWTSDSVFLLLRYHMMPLPDYAFCCL